MRPARLLMSSLSLPARYDQSRLACDGVGTTPRRIILGIVAIVIATFFFVRGTDLAAYPGGNLVLAVGIFLVLVRTLPH